MRQGQRFLRAELPNILATPPDVLSPRMVRVIEGLAAVTAPGRTAAQHQSLLNFVGNAAWSDENVLAKVRELVASTIRSGGTLRSAI